MKNSVKLSVVISSYNGEQRLPKCLDSVKDIADEIIVVNNSSTDRTADVARKYTKKVFSRVNNPMLNVNKNFGFSKAAGMWILNLDDDEQVSPELAGEIQMILDSQNAADGYLIPRKNIIFGKWIQNSIWWPDYQLRLFRRGKGKFAEQHVHELLDVEGETQQLQEAIVHDNYTSVSQWIYKMDKIYTDNEVANKIQQGEVIVPLDAIRYPAHDFFKTFFMQKGYRDGLHGLVLSCLQAFYAEIVFAKIWERQGFVESGGPHFLSEFLDECKKLGAEFQYWATTVLLDENKNPVKQLALKLARKKFAGKARK